MHAPDCKAALIRDNLANRLEAALDPKVDIPNLPTTHIYITEERLLVLLGIITGILMEYTDDGDQMGEDCSCDHFPPINQ